MSQVNKGRAFSTKFEDHAGLLHKFTKGGFARLLGCGVDTSYEDVFQENCVSLVRAQQSYKPESGISFSAYMGRSVINNFNKVAERAIRERVELGLTNIDDLAAGDCDDGCDSMDYASSMVDDDHFVGQEMETMQEARLKIARLSKPARGVIRDLIKPSRALVDQHRAERAHYDHAKAMGERSHRVPQEIDLRFVVKFHGMQFCKFESEIKEKLGVAL